ncbi:putative fluoride ion transporter CrcB [Halomonadaceae bacterium LMG 33818]|uniref:fluoride efflux transporter CrcB n=1 Tax=Cernens ardua TaxID=3402176 RepID=UPI003EDC04D0
MFPTLLAVALGGGVGSVVRWWLGLRMNAINPYLPLGTLTVNLAGGLIIGLLIAFFARVPSLDPVWKALLITGFCGGLTTFSTFSAEVVSMLYTGRYGWGLTIAATHLFGTLLMTYVAFALVDWVMPR